MADSPCHHCGYNLAGVRDYGVVKVCPECGGLTPDIANTSRRWAIRKWAIPIAICLLEMIAAVPIGWYAGRHDSLGAPLFFLAFATLTVCSVTNGVVTLALWTRASQSPHATHTVPCARRTAWGLAFACFVLTEVFTVAVLIGFHG